VTTAYTTVRECELPIFGNKFPDVPTDFKHSSAIFHNQIETTMVVDFVLAMMRKASTSLRRRTTNDE